MHRRRHTIALAATLAISGCSTDSEEGEVECPNMDVVAEFELDHEGPAEIYHDIDRFLEFSSFDGNITHIRGGAGLRSNDNPAQKCLEHVDSLFLGSPSNGLFGSLRSVRYLSVAGDIEAKSLESVESLSLGGGLEATHWIEFAESGAEIERFDWIGSRERAPLLHHATVTQGISLDRTGDDAVFDFAGVQTDASLDTMILQTNVRGLGGLAVEEVGYLEIAGLVLDEDGPPDLERTETLYLSGDGREGLRSFLSLRETETLQAYGSVDLEFPNELRVTKSLDVGGGRLVGGWGEVRTDEDLDEAIIARMSGVSDLAVLSGLRSVGRLELYELDDLSTLEHLDQLESVETIIIEDNPMLRTCEAEQFAARFPEAVVSIDSNLPGC